MTLNQAFGLLIILAAIAGLVWLYVKGLQASTEPRTILVKTIMTAVICAVAYVVIGRMFAQGGYVAAFGGVPAAAVFGVILAMIWRRHITELIARPFEVLYTGGSAPPDRQPFYSVARSLRQQQKFGEAIEAIESQLEQFPDDFNGLMFKAEIQAVDQRDLKGAAETIDRICRSHPDKPGRVFGALSALADWQLQIGRNQAGAMAAFERVGSLFPNHPVASEAQQRIAHLPTQEMLDRKNEPRTIELKEMPKVVIRERSDVKVEVKEETPDDAIGRLVNHLEIHPQDRTAREELAVLYAKHLGDPVLACEQLEMLIRQPGQDRKSVVKWLNLMADYHIQVAADVPAADDALKRIERRFPKSPVAEVAAHRRAMLARELRGKEKSRDVQLGSYEKDLGLR